MLNKLPEPMNWFVGWTMILGTLFTFIIILVGETRSPDDMQNCIAKGGTWSHTLAQNETEHTYDHYNDKCDMTRKP